MSKCEYLVPYIFILGHVCKTFSVGMSKTAWVELIHDIFHWLSSYYYYHLVFQNCGTIVARESVKVRRCLSTTNEWGLILTYRRDPFCLFLTQKYPCCPDNAIFRPVLKSTPTDRPTTDRPIAPLHPTRDMSKVGGIFGLLWLSIDTEERCSRQIISAVVAAYYLAVN